MIQNLLSQQEKINLKKSYRLRFVITLGWMMFFAFFISIIIFVPVYLIAKTKTVSVLDKIQTNSASSKEQQDILSIPEGLNEKTRLVVSFKNKPKVSEKIVAITDPVSGITLANISFSGNDKVKLSGISKNRETLLSYDKKLRSIDFVKTTEVPVGSFAKDSDLSFIITITLKP